MFQFSKDKDNVGHLKINLKESSVNILNLDFINEFKKVWNKIESEANLKGVVISSAKKDNFIAGADIKMFQECKSETEAIKISEAAQTCFNKIANCKIPVVAAIHGACLGGGLELALACDYRIASDSSGTQLAAPETKLGLIPGGGGTVRLPNLIGLSKSLNIMLTGKSLTAFQALRQGLVDEIVANAILLEVAKKYLTKGKANKSKLRKNNWKNWLQHKIIDDNKFGKNLVLKQAKKKTEKKTKGLYPAPTKLLDLISNSINLDEKKALQKEKEVFAKLVMSWQSYNLRGLFIADKELNKENKAFISDYKTEIERVGVIGAGLMGSGISYVTASETNKPVRLKDVSEKNLGKALKNISGLFQKATKHHKMTKFTASKALLNIQPTVNYRGFEHLDLVIEAVDEDIDLKQKIYDDLQNNSKDKLIIASNTSAIPISELATKYDKPQYMLGMHYFSPVHKMPLLEIVKTGKTNKTVLAKAINLGLEQGKKIIIVNDGYGFYTSRVLSVFLVEAIQILKEGTELDLIDKSIKALGFPMGPFELMDEIGLNVSIKIAKFMAKHKSEEFAVDINFDELAKSKSFYNYKNGKKQDTNQKTLSKINSKSNGNANDKSEIQARCLNRFQREAVKCLEEQIIASARDGDLGAVFGLGFPPFEGGPFRRIDRIGLTKVISILDKLKNQHGDRFSVPKLLTTMDKSNKNFY